MEVSKLHSPQAGGFTQRCPKAPIHRRWSVWAQGKWEEEEHYDFCDRFGGCCAWVSEITWLRVMVTPQKHRICQNVVITIGGFSLLGTSAPKKCLLGPGARGQAGSGRWKPEECADGCLKRITNTFQCTVTSVFVFWLLNFPIIHALIISWKRQQQHIRTVG